MSSSTTRKYAEESTIGKRLSNMNVENVRSKRLDLPKLLFTALPKGKYHFARCGGEESRLSIGREVLASFHTLKDKYGELLTWTEKQSLPIKVPLSSAIDSIEGAFMGILVHQMLDASLGSQAASVLGGPWVQARNFAAVMGVNSGLITTMKHIRGKRDVLSFIATGSGVGLTHSLLNLRGLRYSWLDQGLFGQPTNSVLANTLGFAAFFGIGFKLAEFYKPTTTTIPTTDYTHSRSMLLKLGLEKFVKNFKKGHLTDSALPLLTDKSLKEVGIPPGARLMILDHIQRDPEIETKRGN